MRPASARSRPYRMRIKVVLPAPFSPTSAWISPLATSKVIRSLANTPGKAFEISSMRTRGTASAIGGYVGGGGPPGPPPRSFFSVYSVPFILPGRDVVLIGVDSDCVVIRLLRSGDDAFAGAAGHLVYDVGALLELRQRQFLPFGRVTEGVGVADQDLGLLVDVLRPFLVADDELVDSHRLGPADNADDLLRVGPRDLCVLGHHRRQRPRQERSLMLLEDDGDDVGFVHGDVENREFRVGKVWGDAGQGLEGREPERNAQGKTCLRRLAQQLLALADRIAGLDGLDLDPEVLRRLGQASIARIVVGTVAQSALGDDQRDLLGTGRRYGRRQVQYRNGENDGHDDGGCHNPPHTCSAHLTPPLRSRCNRTVYR